ncbi:MAG: SEC-C domain-containing protein, partial [Bryobacterales bacterium]|nr:SEC-C domain-containing protein [Bryobacterales bacterium]
AATQTKSTTCETKSPQPPQVGRNTPCPCGSGQKYKRCCGVNAPPILNNAA